MTCTPLLVSLLACRQSAPACKPVTGRVAARSASAGTRTIPAATSAPRRSAMAPSFPAATRPRDVTASVSIFKDITQALTKRAPTGKSYDVVITYHDPFVNLNVLEWGIEALVDRNTGQRAPQNDED